MLRETDFAATDAARLDDIEPPYAEASDLGASLAGALTEARAAAMVRSRRIPDFNGILAAWSRLPVATQDELGAQAVALAFYGWLSGDAGQEPADRWLTDGAACKCAARSDRALNLISDIAQRSLPELYGTKMRDPVWATNAEEPAKAPETLLGVALASPVQFAIALHRRAWQTLQASSAFLDATGKSDRKRLVWPARDAEDEALTDLLMLSCRDHSDAIAMLKHLVWYLGVGHQHPKAPTPGEADGAFIAVRLRDLGIILGKEVQGAAPVPEPGAMAALIAAHRASWSAYLATPHPEATGWDAHFALTGAVDGAALAFLRSPCADRGEAAAFVEHVRWYSAELEAAGEGLTDGFDHEAQQLQARAGDLALLLGVRPTCPDARWAG